MTVSLEQYRGRNLDVKTFCEFNELGGVNDKCYKVLLRRRSTQYWLTIIPNILTIVSGHVFVVVRLGNSLLAAEKTQINRNKPSICSMGTLLLNVLARAKISLPMW